jgi:glycosyltransferase involved in cell wall biosynthesis
MRIGLNLLYLIPGIVGGTETYALGLLAGLKQIKPAHEFVLFVNRESASLISDDAPNFTKVVCPVFAENRKKRYFFEQFKLKQYIEQYKIDILHSLVYTSPLFLRCPTVVSIHDLNFKALRHEMSFSRRFVLGLIVGQAVRRSNKVIAMSNFSRQEILREYQVPSEKTVVIHEAVDVDNIKNSTGDAPEPSGIKQPYIVAFNSAAVTTNKNIPRLIEAFLDAQKHCQLKQKLVIIGHRYPLGKEAQDGETPGENPDIVWTGYLNRQKVFDILRHSDFLVFPSFYEGFGLPALEAMAAGVPVVCSNTASLPEVVGDAGIFFDPFSVKDMAAKIEQAATDPKLRNNLREKGFKNLERFSWKQTAEQTMAVYHEIMNNR